MVYCLKIKNLRDPEDIHAKFRWGGEDAKLYLLNHMKSLMLDHMLLWEKYTNTYANNDVESSKWLNALLVAYSTDELNIRVNDKFDLLPVLGKVGTVRLKCVLDEMFFVSEAVVQALNNWLKQFSKGGSSKTVGENMSLLMLRFLDFSVRLLDVNKLPIEAATYLL